jgi:hypothetical protein
VHSSQRSARFAGGGLPVAPLVAQAAVGKKRPRWRGIKKRSMDVALQRPSFLVQVCTPKMPGGSRLARGSSIGMLLAAVRVPNRRPRRPGHARLQIRVAGRGGRMRGLAGRPRGMGTSTSSAADVSSSDRGGRVETERDGEISTAADGRAAKQGGRKSRKAGQREVLNAAATALLLRGGQCTCSQLQVCTCHPRLRVWVGCFPPPRHALAPNAIPAHHFTSFVCRSPDLGAPACLYLRGRRRLLWCRSWSPCAHRGPGRS